MNAMPQWGSLAEALGSMGRGKDSIVAHITPREASILKAFGGSGTRNPHTGFLEFDDGSAGGAPATPGAFGLPAGTQTTFPDAAAAQAAGFIPGNAATGTTPGSWYWDATGAGWASNPSLANQYQAMTGSSPYADVTGQITITGSPQLVSSYGQDSVSSAAFPSGAVPLTSAAQQQEQQIYQQAALQDPYKQFTPLDPNQQVFAPGLDPVSRGLLEGDTRFIATPGNPNFSIDPATGQASLTPAGLQAYQQATQQDLQWAETNWARSNSSLPFILPLAFGGLGLSLGAAGALGAFGAGADAAAGGGAAAAELPSTAFALSPATSFLADPALAAGGSVADAVLAPGATIAAGDIGAAFPSTAFALSPSTSFLADPAFAAGGTLGEGFTAGSATLPASTLFGGADAAASAVDASLGAFPTADALSSSLTSLANAIPPGMTAAAPASAALSDPTLALLGSPATSFLGAAGVADPALTFGGTAGAVGGDAALAGGGAIGGSAPLFGGGSGVSATGAIGTGAGGETAWQSLMSGDIGGALSHAGDYIGNAIASDPLKAIGAGISGLGLLSQIGKGNPTSSQQDAIKAAAAETGAVGNQLLQAVNSGQLTPAAQQIAATGQNVLNNFVPQLQQAAQQFNTQAQSLFQKLAAGQLPQVGASQILSLANDQASRAANLESYLTTGTLPPGIQAGIDQAAKAAKAAIASQYAQRGMSDSSAAKQDLANVDMQKATNGANIAMQLYSQGVSQAQLADQMFAQLVNASTSTMQVGLSEEQLGLSAQGQALQAESLGLQAQEAVNSTSNALLQMALGAIGGSAELNAQIANMILAYNQQVGQSISNFASALAGQPSLRLGGLPITFNSTTGANA